MYDGDSKYYRGPSSTARRTGVAAKELPSKRVNKVDLEDGLFEKRLDHLKEVLPEKAVSIEAKAKNARKDPPKRRFPLINKPMCADNASTARPKNNNRRAGRSSDAIDNPQKLVSGGAYNDNPHPMRRASGADPITRRRVTEVKRRIAEGEPTSQVVSVLAKQWATSPAQVLSYIHSGIAEWVNGSRFGTPEQAIAHRRAQLEVLYQRCLLEGAMPSAIQVMDKICRIDGVYASQHSTKDIRSLNMSVSNVTGAAAAEKRLKDLLKQKEEYVDAQESMEAPVEVGVSEVEGT